VGFKGFIFSVDDVYKGFGTMAFVAWVLCNIVILCSSMVELKGIQYRSMRLNASRAVFTHV